MPTSGNGRRRAEPESRGFHGVVARVVSSIRQAREGVDGPRFFRADPQITQRCGISFSKAVILAVGLVRPKGQGFQTCAFAKARQQPIYPQHAATALPSMLWFRPRGKPNKRLTKNAPPPVFHPPAVHRHTTPVHAPVFWGPGFRSIKFEPGASRGEH